MLRYRVFLVFESECRPTWLRPTYLYKYAHDICIGACEWIKLCAQQFATEFLNRDTAMLGATGIVPVSVHCNVQCIGNRFLTSYAKKSLSKSLREIFTIDDTCNRRSFASLAIRGDNLEIKRQLQFFFEISADWYIRFDWNPFEKLIEMKTICVLLSKR